MKISSTRTLGALALATLSLWPNESRADIDVVFALDTTGSMGHELDEAKRRVQQIAKTLAASRSQERIRFGVVAFRDRGDDYVTKVAPLTANIATTQKFIDGLSPGGGGDGPEDVLGAIHAAIHEFKWGDGERQVFVVGDAPPHFDYGGPTVESIVKDAAERRIVINTIGCRSLPSDGIRTFRTIAYQTEGAYQHIGRVSVGEDERGLAAAVLRTLVEDDAPDATASALDVVLTSATEEAGAHLEVVPRIKGPKTCGFDVWTPAGLKLPGVPRVRHGQTLQISLGTPRVAASPGQRLRFDITPCVASSTPLRVVVGS